MAAFSLKEAVFFFSVDLEFLIILVGYLLKINKEKDIH